VAAANADLIKKYDVVLPHEGQPVQPHLLRDRPGGKILLAYSDLNFQATSPDDGRGEGLQGRKQEGKKK
jgi:hypothetical protein